MMTCFHKTAKKTSETMELDRSKGEEKQAFVLDVGTTNWVTTSRVICNDYVGSDLLSPFFAKLEELV